MIMDLPRRFSIGNSKQKNDAYIENGILKIRKTASFRYVVYELTFLLRGGKHKCRYCGKKLDHQKMTMDHMYPQDMGGPTITNNLLPSCQNCNSEKSDMTAKEYREYIKLKKEGNYKEFVKGLKIKKENMRNNKEYQIPKEWICEKQISTIFVEVRLEDSEQTSKYKKIEEFYSKYEHFPKPIIVDRNGFLLDGFYSVVFAKNHHIATLPVIQLENVEVIF